MYLFAYTGLSLLLISASIRQMADTAREEALEGQDACGGTRTGQRSQALKLIPPARGHRDKLAARGESQRLAPGRVRGGARSGRWARLGGDRLAPGLTPIRKALRPKDGLRR